MKRLAKITAVFLSAALIFSSLIFSASAEPVAQNDGAITDEDFLSVKGKKYVNRKGETVTLCGTNLGGWLIQENWMCPTEAEGADGQYRLLQTLYERFGRDEAERLIDIYEDNWITEYDLDIIKNLGFNCVRVPFWYRNFQYDDNGTWIRNEQGEIGLSRLDWIVEQCGKRGIYVVLDLHGAVGFQGYNDHCGIPKDGSMKSAFFGKDEQSVKNRRLTAELWKVIAEHFNSNPVVAMYDLLNEPMCDYPLLQMDHVKMWNALDELYDAVREKDSEHIITMCVTWQAFCIPNPRLYGWENVTYQYHIYVQNKFLYFFGVLGTVILNHGVPTYMGEFKPTKSATWDFVLGLYNKLGDSWTTWSYKGNWCSDWFIVGYDYDIGNDREHEINVNVATDSKEEIERKWGNISTKGNDAFVLQPTAQTQSEYAKQAINK